MCIVTFIIIQCRISMLIGELCYCEVPLFVKWKLLLFEDSYHLSDMLDLLKVIDAFITDINIHNSH